MGFRVKYTYPDGEADVSDEVYDTESAAISEAEDNVLGFAEGADVLDDAGRDYIEGELEYEIIEE